VGRLTKKGNGQEHPVDRIRSKHAIHLLEGPRQSEKEKNQPVNGAGGAWNSMRLSMIPLAVPPAAASSDQLQQHTCIRTHVANEKWGKLNGVQKSQAANIFCNRSEAVNRWG
jgi:hypothetical protein